MACHMEHMVTGIVLLCGRANLPCVIYKKHTAEERREIQRYERVVIGRRVRNPKLGKGRMHVRATRLGSRQEAA